MSTIETRDLRNPPVLEQERTTTGVAAGGSATEAVLGVAVVVLSIIGLAMLNNRWDIYLAAIAGIVLGVGLMFEGASVCARLCRTVSDNFGGQFRNVELGGGMTTQFFGGAAGLILSILAILTIAPTYLMPVAVIVFGSSLILGAISMAGLNSALAESSFSSNEMVRRVAGAAASGAAGAQVLVGLAAIILGIIGLVLQLYAPVLSLVALLCLGSSVVLSGAAVSSKMLSLMRR